MSPGPVAADTASSDGVVTLTSPSSVDETVERLRGMLAGHGLSLFAVVDHSGEAQKVGLELPNTKLVIFGSPAGGTPVMRAVPLSALDLPLKLLVWDHDGRTRVSYNAPAYLAARHHLSTDLAAPLAGVEGIAAALVEPPA